MPAMKIMRRGGDGDTGPSPSKTTSETGSDGKDKALSAKEKYSTHCSSIAPVVHPYWSWSRLSREEREAAYNKARERIFGKDEKTGDATPGLSPIWRSLAPFTELDLDTEDGNEMSRSSSVSTKDRSGQAKRSKPAKQRRDDSEGFDVRSQYTPFFPQPQVPTWVPTPQYSPMMPQQFNNVVQNGYPNPMPQQFSPPNQQFSPPLMNNGVMPLTTICHR